ncbi:MAG: CvpA family protein [Cocleimonas sp.]
MDFNYFDIAIVVIILITALIGFMRGLVWMGIFLATWTAAILLAIKFKDDIAQALPIKLGSEVAQTGLAALLIFLGVLIAGAIVNFLLHKLVNAIGLGAFDRILGTGLGIALGALAITLLTMLLSLTELPNQDMWQKSKFIPKFQEAATWLQTLIPENLNDIVNEKLEGTGLSSPTDSIPSGITPSTDGSTTD